MKPTLDEVIVDIIKSSSEPIRARDIAGTIDKKSLWHTKEGLSPRVAQINARISSKPDLFIRKNGFIELTKNIQTDRRLCKIVWNSNDWIKPMERTWTPAYKDDPNKGWEQRHGFVHEDWLFNSNFLFDGYQYGYIRGIGKLNPEIKILETVYLFTINPSKERLYVGKLYDVSHLQPADIPKNVVRAIERYKPDMVEELKMTSADYKSLDDEAFVPNLRFRVENREIFPVALPITESWFAKKYARTAPIKINSELFDLLEAKDRMTKFNFVPSTPDHKVSSYQRNTRKSKTTVQKIHNEIEKTLFKHLIESKVAQNDIACDTISFGGNLADIVVRRTSSEYSIYEIKTDTDVRRALREAVGQLLDYTYWERDIVVNDIFAVVPYVPLSKNLREFIGRLQNAVSLKLTVLFYDKATSTIREAL